MESPRHGSTPASAASDVVVVIGGGPAGQTCARQLAAHGVDVLLLEAGGPVASARSNDTVTTAVEGDDRFGRVAWKTWRALGGTAWAWCVDLLGTGPGVRFAPFDAAVLGRRGPGLPGWPLPAALLADLERRVLADLGLSGTDVLTSRRPAEGLARVEQAGYVFAEAEPFVRPGVRLAGVRVLTGATVQRLVPDPSRPRTVSAVEYRSADGAVHRAPCRAVVLAAGAVESSLLALRLQQEHPGSVAPRRVGTGIMDRPRVVGRLLLSGPAPAGWSVLAMRREPDGTVTSGRWTAPTQLVEAGCPSTSMVVMPVLPATARQARRERWARSAALDLADRAAVQADRLGPWAGRLAARVHRATYPARSAVLRRRIARGFDLEFADWSTAGWRACREWSVTALVEQLPDRRNRVELDPGADAGRLVWGAPADRLPSRPVLDAVADAVRSSGLGELRWAEGFERVSSHHLMGGLAMGEDPATSATDPQGRLRGTENVSVAGTALFPTSGSTPPTLTALALALHVADAVARGLRRDEPHVA